MVHPLAFAALRRLSSFLRRIPFSVFGPRSVPTFLSRAHPTPSRQDGDTGLRDPTTLFNLPGTLISCTIHLRQGGPHRRGIGTSGGGPWSVHVILHHQVYNLFLLRLACAVDRFFQVLKALVFVVEFLPALKSETLGPVQTFPEGWIESMSLWIGPGRSDVMKRPLLDLSLCADSYVVPVKSMLNLSVVVLVVVRFQLLLICPFVGPGGLSLWTPDHP